jgi:hypothetical protein
LSIKKINTKEEKMTMVEKVKEVEVMLAIVAFAASVSLAMGAFSIYHNLKTDREIEKIALAQDTNHTLMSAEMQKIFTGTK